MKSHEKEINKKEIEKLKGQIELMKKEDCFLREMSKMQIIMLFAERTARNDIWRKSKDERVCKELNIKGL